MENTITGYTIPLIICTDIQKNKRRNGFNMQIDESMSALMGQ